MTDVLFEELEAAGGRRLGVATLDVPATLNALSLPMVRALAPMLDQWAYDAGVACVVLQGAGEKAFCAGGDLRELYASLRDRRDDEPSDYARGFFAEEYALDHRIHTFEKPILCWGHGIVMGGGIGLMAGASHRVVTSRSRLAMPEITVGLYPDVGGSWLLGRAPGRVGLFLALTGAPLNAADALFCGLADVHVGATARGDVLAALQATAWGDDARENRAALSSVLARFASEDLPSSNVRAHFDRLNALMAGDDLAAIDARLRALATEDAWLEAAAATYVKGSPTSAALSFELRRRAQHLSLADVFRLEYDVSLGCAAHADFAEGIRALLIDKDKSPRWSPASLAEITPELVADHFRPRYAGAHPLASLGEEPA